MANLARSAAKNDPVVQGYALAYPSLVRLDSFLRSRFRYRDEIEEIIRTPEFMLNDLQELGYLEGDCDDISTLAASMTKVLGYPTRLTAIASQSPDEYDHVFTEAEQNGIWIPLDITVPQGTVYRTFKVMSEMV